MPAQASKEGKTMPRFALIQHKMYGDTYVVDQNTLRLSGPLHYSDYQDELQRVDTKRVEQTAWEFTGHITKDELDQAWHWLHEWD